MSEDQSLEDLMRKLDDIPLPASSDQQLVSENTDEDKSLAEMMSEIAGKLDELPHPVPVNQSKENSFTDLGHPGLHNLLNRVAENIEKSEKSKVETVEKQDSAKGQSDSLEDMLRTLSSNIKTGDWLSHNTADKWVQENPELAEEFKKAAQKHNS